MKLIAQFLFLHPNIKKLIDFVADNVFISFVKYYRQSGLQKKLEEMYTAYETLDLKDEDMESTETEVRFEIRFFI
jgi:hypothetical protein